MSTDLRQAARALSPCPFCGGDAMFTVEQRENHPDYGGHSAMCGTCGAGICYVFACGDDPRPILMEQWNRRAALVSDDGMVRVPIEPTEAMHVAAVKTIIRCHGNDDWPPRVWRAMIAAAEKETK